MKQKNPLENPKRMAVLRAVWANQKGRGVVPCDLYRKDEKKGTAEIPVGLNKWTTISLCDFDLVYPFSWYSTRAGYTSYAYTEINGTKHSLHRMVLNAPADLWVDHVDRNGLNNTRENIRLCTPGENARNRGSRRLPGYVGKNGYKGVVFMGRRYVARITVNQKNFFSVPLNTAEEAALAYDAMARDFHGEFALLNFPDGIIPPKINTDPNFIPATKKNQQKKANV